MRMTRVSLFRRFFFVVDVSAHFCLHTSFFVHSLDQFIVEGHFDLTHFFRAIKRLRTFFDVAFFRCYFVSFW